MEVTATELSVISGLIIILGAGARGVWVWGWHHQDVKDERDELLRIAMRGAFLAEKGVEAAESEKTNRGNRL